MNYKLKWYEFFHYSLQPYFQKTEWHFARHTDIKRNMVVEDME